MAKAQGCVQAPEVLEGEVPRRRHAGRVPTQECARSRVKEMLAGIMEETARGIPHLGSAPHHKPMLLNENSC